MRNVLSKEIGFISACFIEFVCFITTCRQTFHPITDNLHHHHFKNGDRPYDLNSCVMIQLELRSQGQRVGKSLSNLKLRGGNQSNDDWTEKWAKLSSEAKPRRDETNVEELRTWPTANTPIIPPDHETTTPLSYMYDVEADLGVPVSTDLNPRCYLTAEP